MKKFKVKYLFIILLALWGITGNSIAGTNKAECDAAWQKRINHLKKLYGNKFDCSNAFYLYYDYSEYSPQCGPFCRILDLSTPEKLENQNRLWDTYRANCSRTCFHNSRLGSMWFVGGKDILDFYKTNKEFRSLLPDSFSALMSELEEAVRKGYLENEDINHGTFWSLSNEGLVELIIPADDCKTKKRIIYLFLLPVESTQKINSLLKEAGL